MNALAAEGEHIIEMYICEVPHLYLKPNQLYRFLVSSMCKTCQEEAAKAGETWRVTAKILKKTT